jgi:ryanodine receptor 2
MSINILINQEEKLFGGSAESFGKQWGPGDIVGVFLDLVDHTISKKIS